MNEERLDVIFTVLKKMKEHRPNSGFIQSLYNQYCERGSLSKAQLEGLYDSAQKSGEVSSAHLATIEAIILKKKAIHRSPKILPATENVQDGDPSGAYITTILEKFPEHKRILFLKGKLKDGLDPSEKADAKRIYEALFKKLDKD